MIDCEKLETQINILSTGETLESFKGDELTKRISDPKGYEPDLTFFLQKYLPTLQNPVCFDVGANVGIHTVQLAKFAKEVFCFEPIPFIFKVLNDNIRVNDLGNVHSYNYALSNQVGQSKIFLNMDGNFGGSSIEDQNQTSKEIKVFLKKGDDFVKKNKVKCVDFIKIDVEGHEAKVCKGFEEVIKDQSPVIALEWNSKQTKDDFKLFNLHNTLFQNYFTLPLIDSHLNFRYKSRNELKYKAFRKLLRPLYNILHSKKIGIGKFYKQENYGNLLLVPKNKFEEILTIFS